MKRLKYLAAVIAGQSPESAAVHDLNDDTPFLQGNAEFGSRHPSARLQCSSPPRMALPGDVLVSVRAPVGALNVADQNYGIGRGLAAVRPRRIHDSYLWWWMHTQIDELQSESTGSTFAAISADDIANLQVPVENLHLQKAIAAFLDRETAQIDDLIGKQERLIELLAEKRQAIITHAVTKGLDLTAPRKPSGIPWLGDIPAHWEQKPMCHFMAGRVDYRGATPKKTDDGIFLVTAKNVRKGFIDYSASTEYVAVEDYDNVMSRGIPMIGDILMTMEAPLGNFALIDDPKVALAQRVIKFRPKAELLPAFAVYAANSPYFQAQLEERATGSTALGIKASKLIELRLVAPSREEQRSIVDFLDAAVGRIDGLTQRAKAAISLLRERRSALVSAAVSGKIDVGEGAA